MKFSSLLLAAGATSQVVDYSIFDYHDSDTDAYYFQNERILSTTKFQPYNHFSYQPYVANGYIGSRITNLGFGFSYDQNENTTSSALLNGWPLFDKRYAGAFVAGFYDAQPNTTGTNFPEVLEDGGYESVISAIPQWTQLSFQAVLTNGSEFTLDPANVENRGTISNYSQTLEMGTGTVVTSYVWLNQLQFNVTILAHRDNANLGLLRVDVKRVGTAIASLSVSDSLEFASAQRCWLEDFGGDNQSALYMTVTPENIPYKRASVYTVTSLSPSSNSSSASSTNDSVSLEWSVPVSDTGASITKYVGIASDDLFNTNRSAQVFETARSIAIAASQQPWDGLVASHNSAWAHLWGETRITVADNDYLTLSAEASIYHLLANTRSSNDNLTSALAVGGLSSDSYGGMVFWDADLWMLPGLQAVAPANAASVSRFRKYIHSQAVANAREYGDPGSVYSWTSGRFGNCTGTGPCIDYEYHLNVAICYSLWKLYLSGAIGDAELHDYGWPIMRDTADFFAHYVQYNSTLRRYTTFNMTDPDEYANFKNNAAYTSMGIAQVLKWANLVGNYLHESVNPSWADIRDNLYVAVSPDNVTLEYDTMNASVSVKQADVVLISYIDDQDGFLPNVYGYDRARAYRDLVYYSDKQDPNGPAMTYPAYLAVSEKLNDYGCGYQTYLQQSVRPFLRFPFAQMSEQNNDNFDINGGTHPAFPFLTGHGGVVQSYYYGLLGLRFSYSLVGNSTIQRRLHVDPVSLPRFESGGQNYTIEGFQYLDELIDIDIDTSLCSPDNSSSVGCSATFTSRGRSSQSLNIQVDGRNAAAGVHELPPGGRLTIPLFVPAQNMAGSLTECVADVAAVTPGADGSVIESLTDGDNATIWQIGSRRTTARVLVDLKTPQTFNKGTIVWGPRPASRFAVTMLSSNVDADDFEMTTLVQDQEVNVTSPWDPNDMEVTVQAMNFSAFSLDTSRTARYVLLDLIGVVDDDDDDAGAQIAEFSLFP